MKDFPQIHGFYRFQQFPEVVKIQVHPDQQKIYIRQKKIRRNGRNS